METTPGSYDTLVILGPTATGKTSLAVQMAYVLDGEVVSADSRQVYRGMDLGTGKDYRDYEVEGKKIPCHLIDILEAGERYSLFDYQQDFIRTIADLRERGKVPVICGGSGLYLEAVLRAYSLVSVPVNPTLRKELESKSMEEMTDMLSSLKKLHNVTDTLSRKRLVRALEIARYEAGYAGEGPSFPPMRPLVVGIAIDRETRRKRISERLRTRLSEGMIGEVRGLMEKGLDRETLEYYGLEYKYISLHLAGEIDYETLVSRLEIAIHQFAKRQMTWFRGMERRGTPIRWLDFHLPMEKKKEIILQWYREGEQG